MLDDEWISTGDALEILNDAGLLISAVTLRRFAEAGHISVHRLPSGRMRWLRSEIEAMRPVTVNGRPA